MQFLHGTYATSLIVFVVLGVIHSLWPSTFSAQVGFAMAVGIVGGLMWLALWYILGIPVSHLHA